MNRPRSTAAVLLAGGLAACSFTPAYRAAPSVAPPPATYKEAGDWKVAEPMDATPKGNWWTVFNDPRLDRLESQVGAANQNIKAAVARLQQARAETRIQRASLFPALNIGASATRSRTSVNSPRFPQGLEPVGGNFDLEADLSYEFDVWGRVRNSVNSAKASQRASAADLAALDLSMHAELVTDYFTLCGQDAQQVLLDRTVDDYTKSLQLTQNLYDGGAAALADVEQARALLETARTQAADTRLQRAQSEHAVAVLVGENPSNFTWNPNRSRWIRRRRRWTRAFHRRFWSAAPTSRPPNGASPPPTSRWGSPGRRISPSSAWPPRSDMTAFVRRTGSQRRAGCGRLGHPACSR
jgi:NodT family efflux transporter outer membrane factor (OMF) lipoprotein